MTDVSHFDKQAHESKPETGRQSRLKSLSLSRKIVTDLIAVLEAALVIASAAIAKFVYIDMVLSASPPVWSYIAIGCIGAIISYVSLRNRGLYQSENILQLNGHIRRIAFGLVIAFMFLIALGYFFKVAHVYSRGWMLTWLAVSFFLVSFERKLVMHVLKKLAAQGAFNKKIAIFGAGPLGQKLKEYLSREDLGTDLIGIFDDGNPPVHYKVSEIPIDGGLPELIRCAQTQRLDTIIIAFPPTEEKRIIEIREALDLLPVDVHLCPDLISLSFRGTSSTYMGDLSLLSLHRKPISDWGYFLKVVLDNAGAALLLVALFPLLALVALAIKLDSKGPIFFHQRRHGFNHNIFHVLKFRTMYTLDDGDAVKQATKDDKRVTRVGKFLRRTSLDELPQLWNVLRGDMSLVGPRPHAVSHNDQYVKLINRYASRHKIKPGITGWAQVNGWRGETDTSEKMKKRIEFDLHYIEKWTIWFDLKILLLTPVRLITFRKVY